MVARHCTRTLFFYCGKELATIGLALVSFLPFELTTWSAVLIGIFLVYCQNKWFGLYFLFLALSPIFACKLAMVGLAFLSLILSYSPNISWDDINLSICFWLHLHLYFGVVNNEFGLKFLSPLYHPLVGHLYCILFHCPTVHYLATAWPQFCVNETSLLSSHSVVWLQIWCQELQHHKCTGPRSPSALHSVVTLQIKW